MQSMADREAWLRRIAGDPPGRPYLPPDAQPVSR